MFESYVGADSGKQNQLTWVFFHLWDVCLGMNLRNKTILSTAIDSMLNEAVTNYLDAHNICRSLPVIPRRPLTELI